MKKRSRRLAGVAVALPALVVLAGMAPPATAASPHSPTSPWSVVPSPNPAASTNPQTLLSVATLASDDVWSVGYYLAYNAAGNGALHTLTEHWNGTAWSVVRSPNVPSSQPRFPGEATGTLDGVTTVSADDVWAVGGSFPGGGAVHTLVEHWNGTAWTIVPSPSPATTLPADAALHGVAAVSATDVWAVGEANSRTLVERWDGVRWTVVPSPNGVGSNALSALTVVSANNIWAIGHQQVTPGRSCQIGLIEHWNGLRWSIVPSPGVVNNQCVQLGDVAAVSATDIYAVGGYGTGGSLVEHWNGTTWRIVPTPGAVFLTGVTVINVQDVWAVGSDSNYPDSQTLHFTGSTWQVVTNPQPGGRTDLAAVASLPNHTLWAVGSTGPDTSPFDQFTFILRNRTG